MTWYYARDGRQFGPHTDDEMRGLLASGGLAPHEPVWKAGMAGWAPAHTVFPPPAPQGGPPPPPPPGFGAPPPGPGGPSAAPPYGAAPWGGPGAGPPAYPSAQGGPARKPRVAYVLLGVFLGALGIHNFFAGYTGRAVAQLLVTVLLGWLVVPLLGIWIWNLVEVITVTRDAQGIPFE